MRECGGIVQKILFFYVSVEVFGPVNEVMIEPCISLFAVL